MTRTSARTVVALVALIAAACSSSTSTTNAASTRSVPRPSGFPATVRSCGQPLVFDTPPSRAVSNDINLTEDMLALGLADRMVGTFGVSEPMPEEYRSSFDRVVHVSPDYVKLEPLVALHPDFLFAGWNYGLSEESNLTPESLGRYGIKTYVLEESCAHVRRDKRSVSVDDTYTDVRNLGAIFGVRARAEGLVTTMKAKVSDVARRIANVRRKRVFVYDSGEASPFTAPGLALPDDLIARAGGANVFSDLGQSWTSVSWEQVVRRAPECIVINDYGSTTAMQKRQFLEQSSMTRSLPAVRDHCFLALSYDQLTPGPRNADAVEAMARWLHPDAFR